MQIRRLARYGALAAAGAAILLAGCSGGGDGAGDSTRTGTLKFGITDAPVDFAEGVVVKFTAVELKPKEDPSITIPIAEGSVDLLDYQGTDRMMLLDGVEVPAGEYVWMRLAVAADPNVAGDSYLRLEQGGAECELRIPSGDDPLTSAMVDPATFRYTIGYVPVGSYELAYTCDVDSTTLDADVVPTPPETGEVVEFTPADVPR